MEFMPPTRHLPAALQVRLLAAVISKVKHALVVTDSQQRIIYVNAAYEQMTGVSLADAIGHTPAVKRAGRRQVELHQSLWKKLEQQDIWEGEVWDYRADGTAYLKHLSIEVVRDDAGRIENYFAIFSDLSDQHRSEAELERLTHYDPLTALPNRVLFRNRLGHEFNISNRHNSRTGLVLLNIDRFKLINDAFGFAAGDRLLVEIAQRLQGGIRRTDLLARQEQRQERDADLLSRIGGDDFSFILSELRRPDDAGIVAERLLKCLDDPFEVNGEEIYVSASLGLAVYPDNAADEDALLQCAESALKRVKREGRGGYRFFSEELNISSARRVRMEAWMRNALANEGFMLHYQPKQELSTGRITGMEALVRWPTEEGMIAPGEFIPLAEDTGLINPLGRWILNRALSDAVQVARAVGYPLQIAVNLSMRQFQRPGLSELVQQAIERSGIDPSLVELEITESMVVERVDEAISTMRSLRELGVQLAIDDFGTGYSSMAYLRNFPVNTLKIDQTFVRDLVSEDSNASIIEAVIGLGRGLGMQVVAEGVETALQRRLLEQAGCHVGQGYYIGYPVPLNELIELLKHAKAKNS
ncbi:putative bifunctional diguanylate cyclase/phosphodiesterase [Marinospirillum alkaliphilum]|uniref:PAS domain S-box-containing protein/diguanylate cyclase (GGDEF) domain-containing protein n=1 Tax=Marinospirillum alkaliphilum DSM 21637 TaxID=1122209 RepID=A0A1K1Y313_9GAMM|nr:EAL domain-containing protein [Marinospirillum alkaliphilum]SFX56134.1 PAS domain S-box-containing protein/diguanylate cyclase (GGDEF) domain-containing protein [Marinospirillum alkaliphilum DSM 21637]